MPPVGTLILSSSKEEERKIGKKTHKKRQTNPNVLQEQPDELQEYTPLLECKLQSYAALAKRESKPTCCFPFADVKPRWCATISTCCSKLFEKLIYFFLGRVQIVPTLLCSISPNSWSLPAFHPPFSFLFSGNGNKKGGLMLCAFLLQFFLTSDYTESL